MIRTLLFAGIAAFVGKKLYDNGTLQPLIEDARKRLNKAMPDMNGEATAENDPERVVPMKTTPSAPPVGIAVPG